MGAACARRRPLVAEGETPFWEELDRSKATAVQKEDPPVAAAGAAGPAGDSEAKAVPNPSPEEEKDEEELPGEDSVGTAWEWRGCFMMR